MSLLEHFHGKRVFFIGINTLSVLKKTVNISDTHNTFFHSGNQSRLRGDIIMVVYRGSSVSDPGRRDADDRSPAVRGAKFFNSGPYIPVDQIPAEIKRFFLKTKVVQKTRSARSIGKGSFLWSWKIFMKCFLVNLTSNGIVCIVDPDNLSMFDAMLCSNLLPLAPWCIRRRCAQSLSWPRSPSSPSSS